MDTRMCVRVFVCLLKDLCGLSGFSDKDKIAEGVRAVIVFAYWLFRLSVCVCVPVRVRMHVSLRECADSS